MQGIKYQGGQIGARGDSLFVKLVGIKDQGSWCLAWLAGIQLAFILKQFLGWCSVLLIFPISSLAAMRWNEPVPPRAVLPSEATEVSRIPMWRSPISHGQSVTEGTDFRLWFSDSHPRPSHTQHLNHMPIRWCLSNLALRTCPLMTDRDEIITNSISIDCNIVLLV